MEKKYTETLTASEEKTENDNNSKLGPRVRTSGVYESGEQPFSINSVRTLGRPLIVKNHQKQAEEASSGFREKQQAMQTEGCRNMKAKNKNTDISRVFQWSLEE